MVAQTSSGTERREQETERQARPRQGEQQAGDCGEQGADRGNGQGFPDSLSDLAQPFGRPIGWEEAADELSDRAGGFAREKRGEVDVELPEAGADAAEKNRQQAGAGRAEWYGAGGRGLVEAAPQGAGNEVGDKNEQQKSDQDAGRFAAVEHFHRLVHQLAKTAGADETHHHRGTDGAFPTVNAIRGEFLGDLRHDAIEDG